MKKHEKMNTFTYLLLFFFCILWRNLYIQYIKSPSFCWWLFHIPFLMCLQINFLVFLLSMQYKFWIMSYGKKNMHSYSWAVESSEWKRTWVEYNWMKKNKKYINEFSRWWRCFLFIFSIFTDCSTFVYMFQNFFFILQRIF